MAKAKGSLEKIAIGNKTDTLQWKDGKGENVTQVTCVTFKTETYTLLFCVVYLIQFEM